MRATRRSEMMSSMQKAATTRVEARNPATSHSLMADARGVAPLAERRIVRRPCDRGRQSTYAAHEAQTCRHPLSQHTPCHIQNLFDRRVPKHDGTAMIEFDIERAVVPPTGSFPPHLLVALDPTPQGSVVV